MVNISSNIYYKVSMIMLPGDDWPGIHDRSQFTVFRLTGSSISCGQMRAVFDGTVPASWRHRGNLKMQYGNNK